MSIITDPCTIIARGVTLERFLRAPGKLGEKAHFCRPCRTAPRQERLRPAATIRHKNYAGRAPNQYIRKYAQFVYSSTYQYPNL